MKKYANKILITMVAIIVACFVVMLYKLIDILSVL